MFENIRNNELVKEKDIIPLNQQTNTTNQQPNPPVFEDKRGSIRTILENLNSVAIQLDNSAILEKAKCRFMAGFFAENEFIQWIDLNPADIRKPKVNEQGWTIIEQFIDKNTCPNEILSVKNEKEIRRMVWVESMELNENLCRNHKEYELDLDDIPFLVIECASLAFSGQARALGGQTAKAINQVVKQIENIVSEKQKPKTGLLGRMKL